MTKRLAIATILLFTLLGQTLGPPAPSPVRADGSTASALRRGPASSSPPPEASAASVATGWLQVNTSAFGVDGNWSISSLADLDGYLYAAASNYTTGAQLWRSPDGRNWTATMTDGFGTINSGCVDHLIAFNGKLYAGTENPTDGGEVWRSANGTDWTRVVSTGFGDPQQAEVIRLAVFGGKLYASTWSYDSTQGTEIWRSDTGDPDSWVRVVENGFGDPYNASVPTFEVFGGFLYAGTQNGIWVGQTSYSHGAEVWRSANGSGWSRVGVGGLGDPNTTGISGLAAFGNYLYASTSIQQGGGEVWRCQTCDGSDWTRVVSNGFGNPKTRGMSALETYAGRLYLVMGNSTTGMEVWRTADGTHWEQVGFGGFGDSRNRAPYWDSSMAVWDGRLFVGTWNIGAGGEIWMYLPYRVTLPVVFRLFSTASPTPTPTPKMTSTPAPCSQKAGSWSGSATFRVSADRTTVTDFRISVLACGYSWTASVAAIPISSECKIAFAAGDANNALFGSGTFESATSIRGSWTLIDSSCLGWGSWSSSWRSAALSSEAPGGGEQTPAPLGTPNLERVPIGSQTPEPYAP